MSLLSGTLIPNTTVLPVGAGGGNDSLLRGTGTRYSMMSNSVPPKGVGGGNDSLLSGIGGGVPSSTPARFPLEKPSTMALDW
jgi:hypothetical protein